MGVSGLWELLSPVGRRVPVEQLSGKVVAVDASIWLSQFIAAMRDSEGMMMKNAHLVGFFRRCCKLRFHGVKPIFVFDGKTPAIKKKTLSRRRMQRLKQQVSFKKAAEKLLLNRLKEGILFGPKPGGPGPEATHTQVDIRVGPKETDDDQRDRYQQYMQEVRSSLANNNENTAQPRELVAAQQEQNQQSDFSSESSGGVAEEFELPENIDDLDVSRLAALPPGKQIEALNQLRLGMRARNRIEASNKAADPTAFSQQQISGFLNATTLNHRIRRARGEINHALSGGKTRIASDPTRQIRFEKDSRHSPAVFAQHDLYRNSDAGKRTDYKQKPRADSGVGWAARALQGYADSSSKKTESIRVNDEEDSDDIEWEDADFGEAPLAGTTEALLDRSEANTGGHGSGGFVRSEEEPLSKLDEEVADVDQILVSSKARYIENEPKVSNQILSDNQPIDCLDNDGEAAVTSQDKLGVTNVAVARSHSEARSSWLSKAMKGFLQGSVSKTEQINSNEETSKKDPLEPAASNLASPSIKVNEPDEPAEDNIISPPKRIATEKVENSKENDNQAKAATDGEIYQKKIPVDKNIDATEKPQESDFGRAYTKAANYQTKTARDGDIHQNQSPVDEHSNATEKIRGSDPIRATAEPAENHEDDRPMAHPGVDKPGSKSPRTNGSPTSRDILEPDIETPQFGNGFSDAALESLRQEMNLENVALEKKKRQGMPETVTAEMYDETYQLLDLFGFPYLEAPGEAEAQCAFLNDAGIVDAVITEDSDAFLFGARLVYRNIFFQNKYAEEYSSKEMIDSLGLDRNNLIYLALFLGSDYTDGVRGVGIVNATEIIEAFPWPDGPKAFFEWYNSVTLLDKEPDESVLQSNARARFCWNHRNVKRNWIMRTPFPSSEVVKAYRKPAVNQDLSSFQWSELQAKPLTTFCWSKLAWDKSTVDGVLGPVIKAETDRRSNTNQTTIDSFFKPHKFASIRSKRLSSAVRGMTSASNASNESNVASGNTKATEKTSRPTKRRRKPK